MPIYELDLKNIGPFDDIHFEFDPRINVFIGPNNCGKSTVQIALGDISVLETFTFPEKLLRNGDAKFQVCEGSTLRRRKTYEGKFPILLGKGYWNKKRSDYFIKSYLELGYTCFIPALRRSTDYRAESAASKNRKEEKLDYTTDGGEILKELSKRVDLFETSASAVRDEALIQRMIDLDYRAYRERNPAIRKILEKIAAVASEITDGFTIEFEGIAEDRKGLYPEFKTPDGKMPINVLSQGTQSIIQWVGLLLIGYAEYYNFPKNLEKKPGVVIIDEIDAHMHPSWQRRILPSLSHNFPKLQIFCSAHSPLVLAGLKAGQAHLLKRNNKDKVVVSRNESDIIGWSTDEILRNFLDITNPTDLKTDESIKRLQELRRRKRLTTKQKRELENLRDKISRQLQTGPMSNEVQRFAEFVQKVPPKIPLTIARKKLKKKKKRKTVQNKKVGVNSKRK